MVNRTVYASDSARRRYARLLVRDALGLTPRQAAVLRLILQGKPDKLIASELNLSHGTVKIHITRAFEALKVRTRAGVMIRVAELGGLPPLHEVFDRLRESK